MPPSNAITFQWALADVVTSEQGTYPSRIDSYKPSRYQSGRIGWGSDCVELQWEKQKNQVLPDAHNTNDIPL